jgi:putative hemolysin
MPFPGFVRPLVERLVGFPELNRIYTDTAQRDSGQPFSARALAALDVACGVSDTDLARIPKTGPLIVVANHPFGGLDGLALLSLLQSVRPDVKVMANHLLRRIPELRESMIFVDPYASSCSRANNLAAMRSAMKWVKSGGALGVFPAGEVSGIDFRSRSVVDKPWSDSIARLIRATNAPVVCVWFNGRNSTTFQLAGFAHPLLRTALLPRELLSKRRTSVRAQVGSPIAPQRLAAFESANDLASYLRVRTYLLKSREANRAARRTPRVELRVEEPQSVDALAAEVEALAPENTLVTSGNFRAIIAKSHEIPTILKELGRLREITFRGVGEGTGKGADLDAFDNHYLHLFVWNDARRELVGAYRLGLTDEIVPRLGIGGIYTSTLFRYGPGMIEKLTPGIELGRSFVRAEYQREYAPLLLLWKGIGHFVARHPRYRMLFGTVSISNDYCSMTKQLLITFLKTSNYVSDLARLIAPRRPPAIAPARVLAPRLATTARRIDDVDELVAEIEADRRGVPVLLRQYLKLRAKLLAFNVDPDFGDVLDGLMLVDLTQVDRAVLGRYMGRENVMAYLAAHRA